MTRVTRILLVAIVVVLACFAGSLADEGRVPIYQPTTITAPGHYVVTSEISVASGAVVTVAADNVSIDLNGHSLGGNVVVDVTGGNRRLTLEHGHLAGSIQETPPGATFASQVALSRVAIDSTISLDPCTEFKMTDSAVNGAITVNGTIGTVSAQILDSRAGVVTINSAWKSLFRGNKLQSLTLGKGALTASYNTIEDNAANGISFGDSTGSDHTVVRNNFSFLINAQTSFNHIVGNSVLSGSITVSGSTNVIEDNALYRHTNFCLTLSGNQNIYRNNSFHCPAGNISNTGTGNIDGGGNVAK